MKADVRYYLGIDLEATASDHASLPPERMARSGPCSALFDVRSKSGRQPGDRAPLWEKKPPALRTESPPIRLACRHGRLTYSPFA